MSHEAPSKKQDKELISKKKLDGIVRSVVEELRDDEKASKEAKTKPSFFFKSVSRDRRHYVLSDNAKSPNATHYTPNHKLVSPRVNTAHPFTSPLHTPRKKLLFIPFCLS